MSKQSVEVLDKLSNLINKLDSLTENNIEKPIESKYNNFLSKLKAMGPDVSSLDKSEVETINESLTNKLTTNKYTDDGWTNTPKSDNNPEQVSPITQQEYQEADNLNTLSK